MKKFYTIEELADLTDCKSSYLIEQAVQGLFPISIAANNWYAHVWRKPIPTDDSIDDTHSDINFGDWIRETPLEKPIQLNNTFLELKVSSLIAYQLNAAANVASFEAGDIVKGPDEYCFEFRLCNPLDFSKPHEINLKDHELVVMDNCVPKIKKKLTSKSIKEDIELSDSERTKLLKVIGSLTNLITDSVKKLQINGSPNVNQVSKRILESFDDFEHKGIIIKKTGLSDTNLRDVISKGIKELLKE